MTTPARLHEMAFSKDPTQFVVDYYAITPNKSKSHFTRTSGLAQMRNNAMSETAVLAFLRTKHPGCDVQINSLSFR